MVNLNPELQGFEPGSKLNLLFTNPHSSPNCSHQHRIAFILQLDFVMKFVHTCWAYILQVPFWGGVLQSSGNLLIDIVQNQEIHVLGDRELQCEVAPQRYLLLASA